MLSIMSPLMWIQTPYRDEDAWQDFVGVHAQWHRALAEATRTAYILTDDLRAEGGPHELMHRELGRVLNQPVNEQMGAFDLNDEAGFQGWMLVHSQEHQRFRESAGL